jgi:hypothetical protein
MAAAKWEYTSASLKHGWRNDIREQLQTIGLDNIRQIKGRNCGYVNEEYVAMLHDGTQVPLGKPLPEVMLVTEHYACTPGTLEAAKAILQERTK